MVKYIWEYAEVPPNKPKWNDETVIGKFGLSLWTVGIAVAAFVTYAETPTTTLYKLFV